MRTYLIVINLECILFFRYSVSNWGPYCFSTVSNKYEGFPLLTEDRIVFVVFYYEGLLFPAVRFQILFTQPLLKRSQQISIDD